MPLTHGKIFAINQFVDGYADEVDPHIHHKGLNDYINTLVDAREDVLALIRINEDIADGNVDMILVKAKLRIRNAVTQLLELIPE